MKRMVFGRQTRREGMQIGSLGKKISKPFVSVCNDTTVIDYFGCACQCVCLLVKEVAEVDGKRHTTLTDAIDATSGRQHRCSAF